MVKIYWIGALGLAAMLSGGAETEAAIFGSCEGHPFEVTEIDPTTRKERTESVLDADGNIADRIWLSRIIQANAAAYQNATLSGGATATLRFDTPVTVQQVSKDGSAIRITRSSGAELGWTSARNLLCQLRPVTDQKTGLEQKFFIRTKTAVQGTARSVTAYPVSATEDCGDSQCRELSRFDLSYVFAYDNVSERYLISDRFDLVNRNNLLTGWVSVNDGFLWETNYGVRPREELIFEEGHELAGQEKAICIFPSVSEAKQGENCQPILGGQRWYKLPHRAPILGRSRDDARYYDVAAALGGKAGEVDTEHYLKLAGAEENLKKLVKVDIYFLIDGTASMGAYIKEIIGDKQKRRAGLVDQITQQFENDDALRDAQLRFGFRVYRDAYAGPKEFGDAMPFGANCNPNPDELASERKEFQRRISNVIASRNDKDDVPENLYGGLIEALNDIYACPDNQKVLFIIGDHGYDAEAQQKRERAAYYAQDLIPLLAGDPAIEDQKPIITFVIQTPNSGRSKEAKDAYRLFREQGEAFIEAVVSTQRARARNSVQGSDNQSVALQDKSRFFLSLKDVNRLNKSISEVASGFGNIKAINEVIADLRGGAALVEVIERLQGSEEFANMPGLAWDIITTSACKELGDACRERTFNTVLTGVVEDNEEIEVDVWLTDAQFSRWEKLLAAIPDLQLSKTSEIRSALIEQLYGSLREILGGLSREETNETIGDFVRRKGGLPVGDASVLMSYTLPDLSDPEKIGECEIIELVNWLNLSHDLLRHVASNELLEFDLVPSNHCDGKMSQVIPRADGAVKWKRFPDTAMSYSHAIVGTRIWWVPNRFLP